MAMFMKKFNFLEIPGVRPLRTCQKTLKRSCRISFQMSVKFKESTQWYKFFHVATAIATTVYYKNVTKKIDYF